MRILCVGLEIGFGISWYISQLSWDNLGYTATEWLAFLPQVSAPQIRRVSRRHCALYKLNLLTYLLARVFSGFTLKRLIHKEGLLSNTSTVHQRKFHLTDWHILFFLHCVMPPSCQDSSVVDACFRTQTNSRSAVDKWAWRSAIYIGPVTDTVDQRPAGSSAFRSITSQWHAD